MASPVHGLFAWRQISRRSRQAAPRRLPFHPRVPQGPAPVRFQRRAQLADYVYEIVDEVTTQLTRRGAPPFPAACAGSSPGRGCAW